MGHSAVPENKHEPFVLDSWFDINDLIPAASNFRLSISTKNLLEISKLTSHICTDTTHKVIWQGFPVYSTGTTDMERHFHPTCLSICTNEIDEDFAFVFNSIRQSMLSLFNFVYRPDTLMADAAEAITNGFMKAFRYKSIDYFTRLQCFPHVDRNVDIHLR